ncbi:MAG: ATP-binding protein [Bacillota bacterium]|nr:ATP-binding protein [Bacillota bacterium]
MYIKRIIENKIKNMIEKFPVVLVTGPRQVGKTTILNELLVKNGMYGYITLDDPMIRNLIKDDPILFLQKYETPLIIDEIQYAPELFQYIKIFVDKKMMVENQETNGMYILTGSQMFRMMNNISESLAGRVGILNLLGLSTNEINSTGEREFLPKFEYVKKRSSNYSPNIKDVFQRIFRGSMPKMHINENITENEFYSSYVATYLERDIRELIAIKDERKFLKFLSNIAVRTAQELNFNELAKTTEIDIKTAQNWLSVLETSGIVYLLNSYSNNDVKRIIKRPKLYFMDTGLACYLARYMNAETLEASAYSGSIFETFVVSEIIKTYINQGFNPKMHLYYYRDTNQNEIDLIIVKDNQIFPVEIKKSYNPKKNSMKNFKILDRSTIPVSEGGIICMCENAIPIDEKNSFIPISCI